jgi:phage shock protein C
MGVCAGIANQFGWDVSGVRVVAVLGLIFFTGPTFLAYIIAGALFY